MNGLPTHLNMEKRGIEVDAKCPLCEKAVESTKHALLYCGKICDVWWNWQSCPTNLLAETYDIVDVALQILESGASHDLETMFVTAWLIWYNRNQVVHESQGLPSTQIWNFAQWIQSDYKEAVIINLLRQQPPEVGWATPPPGVYKINVDGATFEDGRPSGVGAVIRDCRGIVVAASAKLLSATYGAEVSEALAAEEGMLLACQMMLTQVILEFDPLGCSSHFI